MQGSAARTYSLEHQFRSLHCRKKALMKPLLFSLTLLSFSVASIPTRAQEAEPLRTWKDSTGSFSIQATFMKLSGDLIVLRRPDKQELSLPLSKLSKLDQQYARQRQAELQRYLSAQQVPAGANLAPIIAAARNNSAIKLAAGTYHLRAQQPYQQGVLIEKKRGLIITGAGQGKTTIKLAPDVDAGFLIGSDVEDLRIEHLHIEGTPPLKTNTAGIGSTSQCTDVRNVTLTNLKIDHVAVGIFVATGNGNVRDLKITNNRVSQTIGVEAGWGYGIHTRKVGNVLIAHNHIEHATRHSIYVRESPARSSLIVEDNFILNHDLLGKNPRWYCAALNCPSSRATTRIANNFFMNTNAVGIAVMTTADDMSLVNNQIIGEHYIGIWPVTGETHTAVGNSILLHATPANPKWSHKINSFDWPNNKESNSQLSIPNPRWLQPDFVCQLDGSLYIMKDGSLDRIDPVSWQFQTSPTKWSNVKGICSVKNVRQSGTDRLYIVTASGLSEVDPQTWETRQQAGDWSGARLVAATTDRVHILVEGTLHSIDLKTLKATQGKPDWSKVNWMGSWGNQLYLFDGQRHHRIDPETLESAVISDAKEE